MPMSNGGQWLCRAEDQLVLDRGLPAHTNPNRLECWRLGEKQSRVWRKERRAFNRCKGKLSYMLVLPSRENRSLIRIGNEPFWETAIDLYTPRTARNPIRRIADYPST